MKPTRNLFVQYPLVLFFILSYLLSWWPVPIMDGSLFPYGPMLAAILVLAIGQGRRGLREWWARLTQWRGGWWYLIGPAIIIASLLGAFGLIRLFVDTAAPFPTLPVAAIWLELLLLGGLWEEPGWTGYSLPALMEKFGRRKNGVLMATLVMALLRAIWHIPLVLSGTIPWFDALGYSLIMQIIITWLYNRSNGSVPVVMVFHFASNLLAGGMMLRAFPWAENSAYHLLFVASSGLIALVILLIEGTSLGKRSRPVIEAGAPALSGES